MMPDFDDLFARCDAEMSKKDRGSDRVDGWLFGKSTIALLVVIATSTGIGATFQLHDVGHHVGEIQVATSLPQEVPYDWEAGISPQEIIQGSLEYVQPAVHNVLMRHHARYLAMYEYCDHPVMLHHVQHQIADFGKERQHPQEFIKSKAFKPKSAFTCGL